MAEVWAADEFKVLVDGVESDEAGTEFFITLEGSEDSDSAQSVSVTSGVGEITLTPQDAAVNWVVQDSDGDTVAVVNAADIAAAGVALNYYTVAFEADLSASAVAPATAGTLGAKAGGKTVVSGTTPVLAGKAVIFTVTGQAGSTSGYEYDWTLPPPLLPPAVTEATASVTVNSKIEEGAVAVALVGKYGIAWAVGGGVLADGTPASVRGDGDILSASASRDGFSFGGWYAETELTNRVNFPVAAGDLMGDVTYYAKWVEVAEVSADLSRDVNITFNDRPYAYTGSALTPSISVALKADGTPLAENVHYTLSYSNNVNAGTAKVTVTGVAESGCAGSVSDTFTVAKAAIKTLGQVNEHLDTSALSRALRLVAVGASGDSLIATGAKVTVPSPAFTLKPKREGLAANASLRVHFEGIAPTVYDKSVTAPANAGDYAVSISMAAGTNYDSIPASNSIVIGKMRVCYELLNSFAVIKDDAKMPFSVGALYRVNGPAVVSSFGAIDTIVYGVPAYAVPGGKAAPRVSAVGKKGADVTIAAGDTGLIELKAAVIGSVGTGANKKLWKSGDVDLKLTVEPKKLTADGVKFEILAGKSVVYDGSEVSGTPATIMVKDGDRPLVEGTDYVAAESYAKCNDGACNRKDAGDAYFVVYGKGNYSAADTAVGKYTINRKAVSVIVSDVRGKEYDGTNALDTVAGIKVAFVGMYGEDADSAAMWEDYTIGGAVYSNKEVSKGLTASATVVLTADGAVSKNYSLADGKVTRAGLEITKRTPKNYDSETLAKGDTATFKFAWPAHYDMSRSSPNTRRGLGAVDLREPMTNAGGTLTVRYSYAATPADFNDAATKTPFTGDTTLAPRNAGSYTVKVKFAGSGANIANGEYVLGPYEILEPLAPDFTEDLEAALKVRQGRSATLKVTAVSPNGGALGYQWWEYKSGGDSVKVGSNSNAFAVPTSSKGTKNYAVWVTNSKSGTQDPRAAKSVVAAVEVTDPPITLNASNAGIALSKDVWTYNGYPQQLGGEDVTVKYVTFDEDGEIANEEILNEGTDYTLSYTNATNVGEATIRVTGIEDYAGSLSKKFTIAKKAVEAYDFAFVESRPYTGDSVGAEVRLVSPMTGAGAITVYYDGGAGKSAAIPVNAGLYDVVIDVAEGANLTGGADIYIGPYEITKGTLDASCFAFTIPAGHREGDTAVTYGIGEVTFKKGAGYGAFAILYNGDTTVPATAGTYTVTAEVSGGENYDEGVVTLGVYGIGSAPVSVSQGNREVPGKSVADVAAVSPVKAVSAEFTAGPSPVSKNAGKVSFFSAKRVKGGSLYVFDASGNAVAKVAAKAGSGEIGSWNLRDKKGAAVPEGTYAVKGALTGRDGTRQKVSFLFSVVK